MKYFDRTYNNCLKYDKINSFYELEIKKTFYKYNSSFVNIIRINLYRDFIFYYFNFLSIFALHLPFNISPLNAEFILIKVK